MAKVTFEAVAVAAEALQAAGQRASVRAVTAAIGGGSPNTVLKMLADWKAGRPVVRIADTELDQRITTAIIEQMQRVATTAAAAAEERAAGIDEDLQALAEAQAEAEQQIEALRAERDTAQGRAADFVDQLKEAKADAERQKEQATAAASTLRNDLATERQRQEATASALARAEVRLEVLPGLQAEADRLRAALDTSQQAHHQAEQQAAVLAAKLDAADRRATEADARTVKIETAAAKASEKAEIVAHELVNANVTIQTGQARLESAARDLEDAKKVVATANAAANKIR
jgi:colicin import membrane protein